MGPTLCDPVDCSPSGSSVHGILQFAFSFSRASSPPQNWTRELSLHFMQTLNQLSHQEHPITKEFHCFWRWLDLLLIIHSDTTQTMDITHNFIESIYIGCTMTLERKTKAWFCPAIVLHWAEQFLSGLHTCFLAH